MRNARIKELDEKISLVNAQNLNKELTALETAIINKNITLPLTHFKKLKILLLNNKFNSALIFGVGVTIAAFYTKEYIIPSMLRVHFWLFGTDPIKQKAAEMAFQHHLNK